MKWELWTGCYSICDGCANCCFYGPHAKRYGQNNIEKTDKFDWPIRTNVKGKYNIKENKTFTARFVTDFFCLKRMNGAKRFGHHQKKNRHRIFDFDKVD